MDVAGPQPDDDGWYTWNGMGSPPSGQGEVVFRDGTQASSNIPLQDWLWEHRNLAGDIVKYRYSVQHIETAAENNRAMSEAIVDSMLNSHKDRIGDAKTRKAVPLASGVLDYFPDALLCVAELSRKGNDQHNPGQPLHWARAKSGDEADALLRHLVDRGEIDVDGVRHSAKVAWRALALLQKELEAANPALGVSRGSR